MQKLHLVGFTTDHKGLILSARRGSRSGGFVLDVDDDVAAAVRAALEQAEQGAVEPEEAEPAPPPRPESALSVKELQARLRAGRSIEAVAAEAGVDVEWVTRFAVPVLAEQARVIDATRSSVFSRARLGPSALRLGASVDRNLAAKGLTLTPEERARAWSTRQLADGRWLVTFTYVSRGRRQKAAWELDLRSGEVRAQDRLAGELAFVAGAPKPATPSASSTKPTKVPATAPSDADRAAARRVAEARKAAEAQLADAARRGTKRSAEAARRAASPKAAAQRAAARLAVSTAAALDEPDALDALGPDAELPPGGDAPEVVTPVSEARRTAEALLSDFAANRRAAEESQLEELEELEELEGLEGLDEWADAAEVRELDDAWGALEDEAGFPEWPADADAEGDAEGDAEVGAEGELEGEAEADEVRRGEPVGRFGLDAERDEEPGDREERAGPVQASSASERDQAPPAVALGPTPARRRRPVLGRPAPATAPGPSDAAVPESDDSRRRLRRGDRVVRTPIDFEALVAAPPAAPPGDATAPATRPQPVFRGDLVSPARSNGTSPSTTPGRTRAVAAGGGEADTGAPARTDVPEGAEAPGAGAGPARPTGRPRRTTPLRAR